MDFGIKEFLVVFLQKESEQTWERFDESLSSLSSYINSTGVDNSQLINLAKRLKGPIIASVKSNAWYLIYPRSTQSEQGFQELQCWL